MSKTKVADNKRRNSKASHKRLVDDLISTTIRRNRDGAAQRKAIKSTREPSTPRQNSSPAKRRSAQARSRPHTRELDHAVQRYADLYNLAPTGYVSFDRSGRIEEINLTAAQLFGITRERLIGMPFMVFVAREDTELFLHHLLRCRSSDTRVETELRLKNVKRKIIHAYLSSTPIVASVHNGALLYQTAIIDLTQRRAAEAALREKEAELNLIVTQTPFMLTRCSRDLRYRYVSRAYAEMAGRKPEEIAGRPIVEIIGKEGLAAIRPCIERVLSGQTVTYEAAIPYQKREPRFVHAIYVPDRNEQGNVIGWFTSLVDLTEQKHTNQALAEAAREERAIYEFVQRLHEAKTFDEIYVAAVDAILAALRCDRASILLYDAGGVMRFVHWRGLSSRYRKAVEGHSPWKPDAKNPQPVCIADVNLAKIPKHLRSAIKQEGIRAVAFIPLVAESKLIGKFMTYYNAPHSFSDDELKLATTIATQLAQGIRHKRDEGTLRESEERLRAIVDQANAGMARYDLDGRIQFANRTFYKMLGYNESELIGKSVHEITHPDDREKTIHAFERVTRNGKTTEIDKRYVRKDGSIAWVNVSDAPERDAAGRSKYVVAVAVDITARKRAEAALLRSNQALDELVRQRTKELRHAITELKSEIERRKGLEGEILAISDREQQRLGQELHDGLCQHLTAVAFMARSVALRLKNHRVIEAGDIEKIAELVNAAAVDTRNLSTALHRADIDSAGFITALEDLVDREIWRIPCRLEVKPSFHIEDDAVAAQLYRIAREAVINANKHSQAREIVIRLERSRGMMVLRVIDDGVGFGQEPKLKKGLGLHIMNYRTQLLGGRLEINSLKQGGTCVSCYVADKPRRGSKLRKQENAVTRQFQAGIAKVLATLV
jgi:PAS domain S-box-containing protein